MIFEREYEKFEPGTVIKRQIIKDIWHYGIVVDNDNNVIHFNTDWKDIKDYFFAGVLELSDLRIKIIKTDMNEFAKGRLDIRECEILKEKYIYSKEEVVKRAESKLGETFDGYSFFCNNCESFCRWAISGERVTNQVPFPEEGYSVFDKFSENFEGKMKEEKHKIDKAKDKIEDVFWDIYINSPFL